jgi:hypothetical protein
VFRRTRWDSNSRWAIIGSFAALEKNSLRRLAQSSSTPPREPWADDSASDAATGHLSTRPSGFLIPRAEHHALHPGTTRSRRHTSRTVRGSHRACSRRASRRSSFDDASLIATPGVTCRILRRFQPPRHQTRFCAIQSLLSSQANISKALWGEGGSKTKERAHLRASIDVDDSSLIQACLESCRMSPETHRCRIDARVSPETS